MIAKKYRILKTLGQGAMGDVYLVLPPTGEPVALKLLKSLDAKANSEAITQFENEFRTLKRLSHPNIGRIFDYGYDEDLQKVFFTLPWLKGSDIFQATKELDFATCENLFVQTLRALNYLHQKDLIHCDLKPGNIYIEENHALLIDFGLTGYWGENIVGTPTYLAPEIFRGGRHTIASDLYAMGVIFYNCLTRSQPFSGKSLQEVYDRHRSFTPPPISEINKDVPKYFADIVSTLLNKRPEERFQSASSVIEEIDVYSEQSYSVETEETLLSYLPSDSDLIGREEAVMDCKTALSDFQAEHVKEAYHLIFVNGTKNVGKSRLVNKIRNDLQLSKISVENLTPPMNEQDQGVAMSAKALIFEYIDSYLVSADEVLNFNQVSSLLEQKILSPTTERFLLVVSSTDKSKFASIQKLFPQEETRITRVDLRPFSLKETERFLKNIVGETEIPEKFLEQFHRNTEGLPGIGLQLIQAMIENGLLFDKSGRWNEDLLADLDKAFDRMEISESLEQDFERIYDSLTWHEEEIIKWMSLCPHPLSRKMLTTLTQFEGLERIVNILIEKKIIREEENKELSFYRNVFQNFIQANLPDKEVQRRHTSLASPKVGLSKKWALYHLSFGSSPELRTKASESLAKIYEKEGLREDAVNTYKRILKENKEAPIQKRVGWNLEMANLLIWLDRFTETTDIIDKIEKEIQETKPRLPAGMFLTLLEKKGLAYLHMQNLDLAKRYFDNGLKYALKFSDCRFQQVRFENDLAEIEFMLGRQDKAIEIFERTRKQSKKLAQSDQQNITNNDLGHVFHNMQKYEECLPYLKEDIRLFSSLRNREPLARALYSYGEALRATSQFDKAVQAYEECVNICKMGNNYPLLLRAYNGLGNLYLGQEQDQQALKNYQKAIEIAVRIHDDTSKAALLFNQGYIYRKSANIALAFRRYLMAKQVLENKEGHLLPYEENLLARCYNELAVLSVQEKHSMKALNYQLERLKLVCKSETLQEGQFWVKIDLAELYLKNRLMDQFQNEIQELEALAKKDKERERLQTLKDDYEKMQDFSDQDATGRLDIQPQP
ncbi:MAG: serine/threonine protein kinase [Deltaproteobacteria bacterium]|nr:serine/threonine protein kinase [Deltaproteobacteria bacterium]